MTSTNICVIYKSYKVWVMRTFDTFDRITVILHFDQLGTLGSILQY